MNTAPDEDAPAAPFFAYRCWSIASWGLLDVHDRTLDRALAEAPRYGISCIELQDYFHRPLVGYFDAAATYREFPRLAAAPALTYGRSQMTPAQRRALVEHLRQGMGRIRQAGYDVQVWYHCFRDWPKEVWQLYPELRDADGEALYRLLKSTLRDGFEAFPEITGVTVTSLHETPSILRFGGKSDQVQRMKKLYQAIYDVCRERGKQVILRDFIARREELDNFSQVLDELPDDVVIQTKNVEADWAGHEKPFNPYFAHYVRKRKRVVVEFELANNYTGEMDLPWCDPEQIWRHLRFMANLGGYGAVGRILNQDYTVPATIFDSPNEINVWAFSRFLVDPGRILQKPGDAWWHDYDYVQASIWTDWAKLRFGDAAASEVVHVLRQTPRLIDLMLNVCGAYGAFPWRGESHFVGGFNDHIVRYAVEAVQRCGADHARSEKVEARRMIDDALLRLDRLRAVMPAEGFANVRGAFDRAHCVLAILEASTEAFLTALAVEAGRAEPAALKAAADTLRRQGRAASEAYGEYLYDRTPLGARLTADWIEQLPARLGELRTREGMYAK